MSKKYYLIKNYSMKCRLYPNKEQAKNIDDVLYGMKVANNVIMYDTFTNKKNTNESIDKNTGSVIHFPNINSMSKAEYINSLKKDYEAIRNVPSYAIIGSNGLINSDIKKSFESQSSTKKFMPIENKNFEPHFYSKSKPRRSYTVQVSVRSISIKNNHVGFVNIPKIGSVKFRGINNNIRFDTSCYMTFKDYIDIESEKINISKNSRSKGSKKITITIKKDACNDYYISFKLRNVYKPMKEEIHKFNVGIDVGVKDVVTLSDGLTDGVFKDGKCVNKYFKKHEKGHIRTLKRRLSRRYGYSNEAFRNNLRKDRSLIPSKSYMKTKLRYAKIERGIARKRENYNHILTTKIISHYNFIGVETLNVTGMFRNKHLSKALTDASMGSILSMIKYKSEWYDRICQPINMWTPQARDVVNADLSKLI